MNRLIKLGLVGILVLIVGGVYPFWLVWPALRGDHLIRAVPHAGWRYTYKQDLLYKNREQAIGIGSPASSLVMVAGFWHLRDESQPVVSPRDALTKLGETKTPRTLEEIAAAARELGYKATIRKAYFGVWSLGAYARRGKLGYSRIPPFFQGPTPVIVEQDINPNYSGEGQIFRVVLGYSPRAKEIYVNDYVYGVRFAIPRADFLKMWRQPRRILVIEPKNRRAADNGKPKFTKYSYKEHSANYIDWLARWYIAEEARRQGNIFEATARWENIVRDPKFSSFFSRTDAIYHYTVLMSLYFQQQRARDLVKLESRVRALNQDLNGSEPGAPQNYEAWLLLAKGFYAVKKYAKAAEYANMVLPINPDDPTLELIIQKDKEQKSR